jgi:hypothetical protein
MSRLVYLLDTSIVGYYPRRTSLALEKTMADALRKQVCALFVLTRAELRHGQALMETADRRCELIDAFLRQPWRETGGATNSSPIQHKCCRGATNMFQCAHEQQPIQEMADRARRNVHTR